MPETKLTDAIFINVGGRVVQAVSDERSYYVYDDLFKLFVFQEGCYTINSAMKGI